MSRDTYVIHVNGEPIDVSEEVYLHYYRAERRMRYFQSDIKNETPVRDEDGQIVTYVPSKEVSLEQLLEAGATFAAEQESVEELAVCAVMSDKLHRALDRLPTGERELIHALFWDGLNERKAAAAFGLSQKGVNKRKVKILSKLKKLLEF